MNVWIVLLTVLFSAVAVISIIRYLRTSLSIKTKAAFISLRLIQMLLIAIALLEPSFQFEKVASLHKNIPVLIDASLSMSLFHPDTTILSFIQKLQQINNSSTEKSRKFEFYVFGDSLRKLDNPGHLKFIDKQSKFPINSGKNISTSRELIIITDANWSNSFPLDAFADKNIHYLELSGFKQQPFLRFVNLELPSSPSDSLVTIPLTIEGRTETKKPVEIVVTESGRVVSKHSFAENPGYFKRTLNINLPPATPGKHLYRFRVSQEDSLQAYAYDIHYIRPRYFTYQHYCSPPSLDSRFISLTLSKHSEFKKMEADKGKADCIFFFSWEDSIKHHLKDLKQNGIAVFAGCLPCSASTVTPSHYNLFNMEHSLTAFDDLILEKLPPPSGVLRCASLQVKSPLLCMLNDENQKKDTLHLLFNTEWQGYQVLALAAKDFWRWDFWPMSLEYSEEQAFSFSGLFITTLTEQLLTRISEQYFIYPASSISESDSIIFTVSFPSTIPVACKSKISFTIKNSSNQSVLDTAVEIINNGSLNRKISLKPLSAGIYSLSSSISGNQKKYTFSDTLFIGVRQSELQIPGQNKILLSEIGHPFDPIDSTSLFKDMLNDNSNNDSIVKDSYQLNRTWLLLSCILILMGFEWMYRRLIGLD